MTLEKLKWYLEQTELTLKNLNFTIDNLESFRAESNDDVVIEKLNNFIKEIEKEIDFEEHIKDEIEQSIIFRELKGGND